MKTLRAIIALAAISFFPTQSLMAHETNFFADVPMNMTFGTGLVNGSYSNPIQENYSSTATTASNNSIASNGFQVAPSFSLMFEFFSSVDKSWHLKANIAMDSVEGKMKYSFLGGGANYYFGAGNIMSSMDEKWMHYAGYDLGLSRLIVISFGPALNGVSTAFDIGGHIGTNYRLNKEWNINAEIGASYAFGFSTVAVNGYNLKSFIGISHIL